MAQRLVRINCAKCKEPYTPPIAEIKAARLTAEQMKGATFMRGKGCKNCNGTGYRGRKGIFEMLAMNAKLREMTFGREPTQVIRKVARQNGMRTLLEDGLIKAVRGVSTLEEVMSTCHHDSQVA